MQQNEWNELLEQRAKLLAKAEELSTRALDPEASAAIEGLVQQIKDIDARLLVLEGEDQTENDPPSETQPETQPMAEDPQPRSAPAVSVRNLPQPPAVPQREERRVQPAPNFVRDLNDRNATRTKDLALRAWALAPTGRNTPELLRAANEIGFDLNQRSLSVNLWTDAPKRMTLQQRAQATTSVGAGGALVPTELVRELESAMLYTCPIRDYVKVVRSSAGNPLEISCLDDTANKGEIIAENAAQNAQDLTFTKKTLGAYKYSSKIVLISLELLQDSALNVQQIIGNALGERLGRIMLDHFTVGTGTAQPTGIVTGAGAGVTSAATGAVSVDDLLSLVHSVDRAYRDQAAFMLPDAVLLAVRKLKDSTGQPIFTPSYREGEPDTLLGYPVAINNSMVGTLAASTKPIVFGSMEHFWIRDSLDIQIVRSDERYFEYAQSAFVALARADSNVINTSALKVLTIKA